MTDTNAATVLIAEDDQEIRTALQRILSYEGYETLEAADGAEALDVVLKQRPDAIVLDVMMPFVDGLTVCRRMREKGDRTPILMLTAKQEVDDRVEGLDAGADDFLSKPFELPELLARLRALLRRVTDSAEVVAVCGDLSLNPERHEVRQGDQVLDLTRTEFQILHLLMRNPNVVLEREDMYEQIWGYDHSDSASRPLDVHIGYLRRKLEESGNPRVIETVRGVGFMLRCDGDR